MLYGRTIGCVKKCKHYQEFSKLEGGETDC